MRIGEVFLGGGQCLHIEIPKKVKISSFMGIFNFIKEKKRKKMDCFIKKTYLCIELWNARNEDGRAVFFLKYSRKFAGE